MGLHEVVFKVLAVLRENQILLGIRLGNGTHRLAGIAEGQIAIGNILGDNAAGTDYDIVADMHAAQHHCVAGDPDIVSGAPVQ